MMTWMPALWQSAIDEVLAQPFVAVAGGGAFGPGVYAPGGGAAGGALPGLGGPGFNLPPGFDKFSKK